MLDINYKLVYNFCGDIMRVISGKYKGKKILGFDTKGTRPTMDRVKESLFGTIQNHVKNSVFLDLFAGSGSIGLEALSNGASRCYFVDSGKDILKILNSNLKDIDNSIIINKDYIEALNYFKDKNIKFDIIYIDPPYHLKIANNALNFIKKFDLLKSGGIVVIEYEEEIINDIYPVLKTKKYGKTYIKILENK